METLDKLKRPKEFKPGDEVIYIKRRVRGVEPKPPEFVKVVKSYVVHGKGTVRIKFSNGIPRGVGAGSLWVNRAPGESLPELLFAAKKFIGRVRGAKGLGQAPYADEIMEFENALTIFEQYAGGEHAALETI